MTSVTYLLASSTWIYLVPFTFRYDPYADSGFLILQVLAVIFVIEMGSHRLCAITLVLVRERLTFVR
jgi:hypothetical protein